MKDRTIASLQCQFAALPVMLQHAHEMAMPVIPTLGTDVTGEAAIEQFFALHSQQRSTGKIHLGNHSFAGKREITDGREFIKIHVAVTRFFYGDQRPPQLLILHFQFDLMQLEFVQDFLRGSE